MQEENKVLNSYILLEPIFPWSYNPGMKAVIGFAQLLKRRKIPNDILKQYKHIKDLHKISKINQKRGKMQEEFHSEDEGEEFARDVEDLGLDE